MPSSLRSAFQYFRAVFNRYSEHSVLTHSRTCLHPDASSGRGSILQKNDGRSWCQLRGSTMASICSSRTFSNTSVVTTVQNSPPILRTVPMHGGGYAATH